MNMKNLELNFEGLEVINKNELQVINGGFSPVIAGLGGFAFGAIVEYYDNPKAFQQSFERGLAIF